MKEKDFNRIKRATVVDKRIAKTEIKEVVYDIKGFIRHFIGYVEDREGNKIDCTWDSSGRGSIRIKNEEINITLQVVEPFKKTKCDSQLVW